MSTDNSTPSGTPVPAAPGTPAPLTPAPDGPGAGQAPYGGIPTDGTAPGEQLTSGHQDESWFGRHSAVLVAAMVAIVIAAVAIAGLAYYRNKADDANTANEAAFANSVAAQGATVETVECNGDTCAAVISGQAYSVLVQKDAKGKKHFGVSAFAGK